MYILAMFIHHILSIFILCHTIYFFTYTKACFDTLRYALQTYPTYLGLKPIIIHLTITLSTPFSDHIV